MGKNHISAFEYQCFQGCFYKILTKKVGEKAKLNLNFLPKYSMSLNQKCVTEPLRIQNDNFYKFTTLGTKNAIIELIYDDAETMFCKIDELLEQNIMVVLAVNIRSFSYHPFHNTADFIHGIIVSKKKDNNYYITDDYAFWQYEGWMKKQGLSKALDLQDLENTYSYGFPKHCMYWIEQSKLCEDSSQNVENFKNQWLRNYQQEKIDGNGRITYLQKLLELFQTDILSTIDYNSIYSDIYDMIHDYRLINEYLMWVNDSKVPFNETVVQLFEQIYDAYGMLRKRILKVSYQKERDISTVLANIIDLIKQETTMSTYLAKF